MANQLDTKHLALASLSMRGLGHKSVITILSKADTIPQTAADFETLLQATIGQRTKERTTDEFKAAFDRGGSILADATAQNIVVCPYNDPIYPVRLRSIENPPSVIYVKGNLDCLSNSAALAIVGTRHPTTWGGQTARRVAHRCAENHVTVVSGLALGCDTSAHEGTLNGRGITVAVLAHGLNHVYPASNRDLSERIISGGGALVSEYEPDQQPQRTYFIQRDRLQSGLSRAVLVVETDVKGGTMHTVNFASKQGREVACISHPPDLRSENKTRGNQKLLTDGKATAIEDSSDLQALIDRVREIETPKQPDPSRTGPQSGQLGFWRDDNTGDDPRS